MEKPNIFFVKDRHLGLVAFSPYSGLMYAIHQSYENKIASWVSTGKSQHIPKEVESSLGAGWSIPLKDAIFFRPHLLPSPANWSTLPQPEHPLLINWLITGLCPLGCEYCYAEDLMRDPSKEPGENQLKETARAILKLKPAAVVLSGGDPLFGSNFFKVVPLLAGKTGLIVDTSGYTLNSKHLELIREHQISVRISLDSENPRIHNSQRPVFKNYPELQRKIGDSFSAALIALTKCIDNDIPVTVQTVATKNNANDLIAFGEKIRRIGVTSWRVLKVSPSKSRYKNYQKLVGYLNNDGSPATKRGKKGPYKHVFKQLVAKYPGNKHSGFSLQISSNNVPNNVILVGPDGVFYTESNVHINKVVIDEANPKAPSLESVHSRVDMIAHAKRYLNLTTEESL